MCYQGAERSVVSLEYEDHESSMGGDVEVGRGCREDDRTQRGGSRVRGTVVDDEAGSAGRVLTMRDL